MKSAIISVVAIFLSLILPWASNWDIESHWFLFGYSIPLHGFRVFQEFNVIWVLPFLFMILGLFCAVHSMFKGKVEGGISSVVGTVFILLAIHFFMQIYSPMLGGSPLQFDLPLSIGIFLAMLGAFFSLVTGMKNLISNRRGENVKNV